MKNVTLSVDETVLEQVRIYAAKHKTTVNRLVRDHLEQLARAEAKVGRARERLLELVDKSPGRLGPDWKWNREDRRSPASWIRDILLYAALARVDDPEKLGISRALLAAWDFGLSSQVLGEFFVNAQRKSRRPLRADEAAAFVAELQDRPCAPIDRSLVDMAIAYARRFQISYWDAAIVAAAERLDAPVIYSEDFNHGQAYGAVRVENPFRRTRR